MKEKITSFSFSIALRRTLFATTIICCGFLQHASAQVFWTETFGTGCNHGQLAINAPSANGSWTITSTGINDPFANEWYISGTESGFPAGTCRDGCLLNPALTNQTLHVGNVAGSTNSAVLCASGDCGASYDPGGVPTNQITTHKRIESPTINCTGRTSIILHFNYFEGGFGTSDNATVWCYNGSTWAQIADPPKTNDTICAGEGYWTSFTVALPGSLNNNPSVKIGFRWDNNDDGTGVNPSFAVDDITLSTATAPVVADFSVDSISGGCAGHARHFTDLSAGVPTSWSWLFPGGNPASSNSQNPVVTYALPGTYTVQLIASNFSSSDTIIRTSYLTIINCSPPVADFVANTTHICQNHCINFTDLSQNSPTNWQWSFPFSNTPTSSAQNPSNICYSTPGTYNVQLVASNAFGSSTMSKPFYITIDSCPPPVGDFSQSSPGGCDTVCINFFDLSTSTPNPVNEWHWYFPGGTPDSSNVPNPTNICYTTDGLYDVILIVGNGNGYDTITKYSTVNITSVPTATVNGDTTMHFGESYHLLAGGGISYFWFSPGVDSAHLGLDTNFVPNPIATPSVTTTYYCLIGDGTGCYAIRQVIVTILRDNRIYIPDAFSPNGDGKNDVFRIRGNNIFSARLVIYDRWGEKVFETDDKNTGWDGTFNGKKVNAGVYTYAAFVVYELKEGKSEAETESRSGTIAVIR
jgi:gliding motility-associated-like protein